MANETFGSTTIISDVGPTANSYISVADAKAYYDFDYCNIACRDWWR